MFSKNKTTGNNSYKETRDGESRNLIGKGTQINGNIISEGAIRIEGILEGMLDSKSKVIIGATGVVKGNISCENLEVAGKVKGKMNVNNLLHMKASAKIHGEIFTNKIEIESGAVFNGNCQMGSKVIKGEKTTPKVTKQLSKQAV